MAKATFLLRTAGYPGGIACEIEGQAGEWCWHKTWIYEEIARDAGENWAPWSISHMGVGYCAGMYPDADAASKAAHYMDATVGPLKDHREWDSIPRETRREWKRELIALGAVFKRDED